MGLPPADYDPAPQLRPVRRDLSHLPPAIQGLAAALPPAGAREWPERERWERAFTATMDLLYPPDAAALEDR